MTNPDNRGSRSSDMVWIKESSQIVVRDVLLRHCSRADVLVYHTRGDGRFSAFISVPPGEQEYLRQTVEEELFLRFGQQAIANNQAGRIRGVTISATACFGPPSPSKRRKLRDCSCLTAPCFVLRSWPQPSKGLPAVAHNDFTRLSGVLRILPTHAPAKHPAWCATMDYRPSRSFSMVDSE